MTGNSFSIIIKILTIILLTLRSLSLTIPSLKSLVRLVGNLRQKKVTKGDDN